MTFTPSHITGPAPLGKALPPRLNGETPHFLWPRLALHRLSPPRAGRNRNWRSWMIVKTPSLGDWTEEICEPFEADHSPRPTLHDTPPVRRTGVLGPDGEEVSVDIPRRRIGFVLPHERGSAE